MATAALLKKLPIGWADEADAMDEAALRNVIVESNNNIRTSKQEMDENEGFKNAKEAYKLAAEPFKDAVKAQNAKIQYALLRLEEMGKL